MTAEPQSPHALDPTLLPAFLAEADELLPRIDIGLCQLEQGLADAESLRRLQRSLHTFKGTARMTGALDLGERAHHLELRIKALLADASPPTGVAELRAAYRAVVAQVAALKAMPGVGASLDAYGDELAEASIEYLLGRLQRTVDLAALESHKQVHLRCLDNEVYFERRRLDALAPALEHLLRNAVAHGIEAPEHRRALGKPAAGEIELTAARNEDGVLLLLADDGAGIDGAAVRARAEALGLASTADALDLIFAPNLSTVAEVNPVAGMGVGLDAVRALVAELGGRIGAASEPGRGTEFRIWLPD